MADTLNIFSGQTPQPKESGAGVWLTVLGLCVAGGIAGYFWLESGDHGPAQPAVVDAGQPEKPTLPSFEVTDAKTRELSQNLSTEPEWAQWLRQTDLVRIIATSTYNIAQGESPRAKLSFLAPAEKFATVDKGRGAKKKTYIDPKSYARYDTVARVFGSIDPQGVKTLYDGIKDWLELAYDEVGPEGQSFYEQFFVASNNLTNVTVPTGDVEVTPKGAIFAFADPALEGMSAAQKHLLRMGPKNAKIIQDKLVAIGAALRGETAGGTTDGGTMESTDGGAAAATGTTGTGTTTGTATDAGATGGTTGSTTGATGTNGTATDAGGTTGATGTGGTTTP